MASLISWEKYEDVDSRARRGVGAVCVGGVRAREGTAERRRRGDADPEKIIGIAGRGYAGVGLDSRASKRWGIVDAGVGLVFKSRVDAKFCSVWTDVVCATIYESRRHVFLFRTLTI